MYLAAQTGLARTPRGHSQHRRRASTIGNYAGMGALTPDQAAQTAMPSSTIRNTPGFTQAVYNEIVNAAATSQFTDYNGQATSCLHPQGSSSGAQDLKLVSSSSGLALKAGTTTGLIATGPVTLGITIAIAGIVGIFSTILAHHAAAVAKENRILCASGPAANNYLQIILQAVQSGQATPAQGKAALQSLLADYTAAVKPIIKNNSSQCNAACVELKELQAIVAYQSSVMDDLAAAQAANPAGALTQPLTSAAASLGIPSWVLYAAGGVLLWKLL